jgi:hypothetical protein
VVPGWFAQTHEQPDLYGRTLVEVLHRGTDDMDRAAGGAGPRAGDRRAASLRAARPGRPGLRHAVGRPAGALAGAAARAVGLHDAAARRADRQPRPRQRRGARGGSAGVRRHGRRR